VLLSSGTYILSPVARRSIPPGPVGTPQLVNILLDNQQKVAAFSHASPWIDVNDSSSVHRAENLIAENFACFEHWRQFPHREVAVLAVLSGSRIAVDAQGKVNRQRTSATLPAGAFLAGKSPIAAARRLRKQIGLTVSEPEPLASLDELNPKTGQRIR